MDKQHRDVPTDAPDEVGGPQHVGNVPPDAGLEIGVLSSGAAGSDQTEGQEVLVAGTAQHLQREQVTEFRFTERPRSALGFGHRSPRPWPQGSHRGPSLARSSPAAAEAGWTTPDSIECVTAVERLSSRE